MNTEQQLRDLGLPPADQIGFVVRNLREWTQRYEPMFGPFRYMDGSVQAATYRGREEDAKLAIAFGRSGDLEIEFIEWQGGHGPHREFIDSGREGMHHIRFRVEDTNRWIEQVKPLGFEVIWYKKWSEDTIFAYLESRHDGLMIEFLQMPEGGPGANAGLKRQQRGRPDDQSTHNNHGDPV